METNMIKSTLGKHGGRPPDDDSSDSTDDYSSATGAFDPPVEEDRAGRPNLSTDTVPKGFAQVFFDWVLQEYIS